MGSKTYLQKFKKKLLARGDAWCCSYCGIVFVPDGISIGQKPYYTDEAEPNTVVLSADGNKRSAFKLADGYCNRPTIDHVIPRKQGGSNALENLVFSCAACNTKKKLKNAEHFTSEVRS